MFGLAVSSAFASELAILHNGFSIRHEKSEIVGTVTRLYLGTDRSGYVDIPTNEIDRFEKDLTPAARPSEVPLPERPQSLNEVIDTIGNRHHIDPYLINSVIHAESGFNARAVSPKGAQGLMQLMPHTASQLGVANAFDPKSNVEGGTRYLRELLERYNFDLVKALAAYNAGPHRVEQYRGVPPYYETRAYVASIIRDFNRKKRAQQRISAASKSKAVTSQPQLASTKKHSETSASQIEPLPGSH
ncbi:MAG: lytic transglycosylase domain-containing protein [Acidobacteria bacterium]|nr:MAG: lytic transglycosylase domain-containing protein [Acidobacteriota bacterium]